MTQWYDRLRLARGKLYGLTLRLEQPPMPWLMSPKAKRYKMEPLMYLYPCDSR